MINKITSSGTGSQPVSLIEKKTGTGQQGAAAVSSGDTGSVTLSGHALMLSRLFGQDESTYTGEVLTDRNAATSALTPYLTGADRTMLESMYDYSVDNGIDLQHVDALGRDLASYRRFGASSGVHDLFDAQGHALTVAFSKADQTSAERIAGNSATSTIDQGFLQSELVVGARSANFAFLERMTEVFSTRASSASGSIPLANQASIAAYNAQANQPVVTASKDVQLVIPEADYTNVNGVGHWRTPELEAEHNARMAQGHNGSGVSHLIDGGDDNIRDFLTMLDGYAQNRGISRAGLNSMVGLLDSTSVNRLWADISTPGSHDKAE